MTHMIIKLTHWYTVALGLDEADVQRQMLDVYTIFFQAPFLETTCSYYKAESETFVANNSVPDYMKKAEDRLQEESDRVNLYLHDSTRKDVRLSFPRAYTRLTP